MCELTDRARLIAPHSEDGRLLYELAERLDAAMRELASRVDDAAACKHCGHEHDPFTFQYCRHVVYRMQGGSLAQEFCHCAGRAMGAEDRAA